jgi:triosephosphate isomerase
MRSKLVVGNWKMHGDRAGNERLIKGLLGKAGQFGSAEVAVCVPYPYLAQVASMLSATPLLWGAQNLSEHAAGAYTGEVSAAMLAEFGCRYVIVGHSERRALYGDTDAVVAAKFMAAQAVGMKPILCLGETLAERDAGVTLDVVGGQLDAVLAVAGVGALARAVVAYEPVWAIGTGRTASPGQAQEVHAAIRGRVAAQDGDIAGALQLLYGGSVKAPNAAELFACADIDGGLVGGASLVVDEFVSICESAGC